MEGGTEALASAGEAVGARRGRRRSSCRTSTIAVIRALQGDMAVVPEPYAAARGRARDHPGAHARAPRVDEGAPGAAAGGRDPLPPPGRVLGERHGRVARARGAHPGAGAADGRLPRHLPLLPAPHLPDWPYSVFTMAHGRSKEECDAILDSIAEFSGIEERSTLYSLHRVQEDPPPLLHGRAPQVGGRALLTETRSAAAFARAARLMPGGVNSPVRAMRSIGRDPLFVARGEGAELIDVDGNRYVDWVMSWGPLIGGPRAPRRGGRRDRRSRGAARASARPPRRRASWRPRSWSACPRCEMVRMTSSGTEASA